MLGLSLPTLLGRILTLVIALTFHEFAHAWAANRLGDDTPRLHGRLTLNPLAHLDFFGSLMLILAGFGWAKPVPVNPYILRRRNPAGLMLVSAAGPLSNLLLAIGAAIPLRMGLLQTAGSVSPWVIEFLSVFIFINLILFFFNLIPISPLDGEKVAEYFLPPSGRQMLLQLRPYGPLLLMALIFVLPRLGIDILGLLIVAPSLRIFSLLVS
jgi:Zn-dependent protease